MGAMLKNSKFSRVYTSSNVLNHGYCMEPTPFRIAIPIWNRHQLSQCMESPKLIVHLCNCSLDNTELSQIEHRRILGRRAINCDCLRHSSAVLLICDFANWRTYSVARDRGQCTHESPRRAPIGCLTLSFLILHRRQISENPFVSLPPTKRCGGSCMRRSIFISDYHPRVHL